MELFGRKINNNKDLFLALNRSSVSVCNSALKLVTVERKQMAEDRMSRETDPVKKSKMQALIDQGEYNFDLLFGPESR